MAEIVKQMTELVMADLAAKAVGCNRSTLYKAAQRGQVPCYRMGRALRFDVEELRAWMRTQANRNAEEAKAVPA